MGLLLLTMFLLVPVFWCPYSHACLQVERNALLQIKQSFDAKLSLHSWVKDADCCNWEGIECYPTTGQVILIDLSDAWNGNLRDHWYLNASLFLPFHQLNSLILRRNRIIGCVKNEGFERLSRLDNLEFLDLSNNMFNNNIFSSLSSLSSLKTLYLTENKLKGSIHIQELNKLRSLEELDLTENEIEGFKSFHDGDELLKSSNLEYLYLGQNRFDNQITSSLRALPSLQYLDLGYNQMNGAFNMSELEALCNLRGLYLDGNEITELVFPKDSKAFGNVSLISLSNITTNGRSCRFSLLQSLVELPNLKKLFLRDNNFEGTKLAQALLPLKNLEELDLGFSVLHNNILETIGRMTNLRSLSLDGCRLNGTIPTVQGLCELKHLRYLDIRNNNMTGTIPWCLANMTSIQYLDFSFNHFTGDISSSPLTSLASVQTLLLSNNHFQVPITLNSFFNHSKLIKFTADSNKEIYAKPYDHNNMIIPKFQLEFLDLSGPGQCGAFPKFLFYQYSLVFIDFSSLKMIGEFPNWLLENNTNLETLHLANNSLSRNYQLPKNHHLKLSYLDISDNYLDNHIPTEIGTYFPSLKFLSLSGNDLVGSVPSSLNSLPLLHLSLSYNSLQGSFEDALRKSFELITLDLSHNRLTGRIPIWIGEISYLSFLLLDHNNLQGILPIELCKLDKLNFIDLSHNSFSGHIPPCLRFRSNIWYNQLEPLPMSLYSIQETLEITTKGISYTFSQSILPYMSGIDLAHNNLTGDIPLEIGNLNQIRLLNLSYNHLMGPIPETFSNLSQVESLDLSNNNLNGKIPPQLIELHSLSAFSVAHDNLSGKIPKMVAQFSTFKASSYEGNPSLCGPPLLINCTEEEEPPSSSRTSTGNEDENSFMDTKVFYVSFFVTYIMVLIGITTVLCINPSWRRAWFCFIEKSINNCYYFFVDNFLVAFGFKGWKPLV